MIQKKRSGKYPWEAIVFYSHCIRVAYISRRCWVRELRAVSARKKVVNGVVYIGMLGSRRRCSWSTTKHLQLSTATRATNGKLRGTLFQGDQCVSTCYAVRQSQPTATTGYRCFETTHNLKTKWISASHTSSWAGVSGTLETDNGGTLSRLQSF